MALVSSSLSLSFSVFNVHPLTNTASYAVYIGILAFYFCLIFFLFPETKRLSAEDASRVFDYDRKGLKLGKSDDDGEQSDTNSDTLEGTDFVENNHKE